MTPQSSHLLSTLAYGVSTPVPYTKQKFITCDNRIFLSCMTGILCGSHEISSKDKISSVLSNGKLELEDSAHDLFINIGRCPRLLHRL